LLLGRKHGRRHLFVARCTCRGVFINVHSGEYAQSPRLFSGFQVSHNYKPARAKITRQIYGLLSAHASINNGDTEYSAINIFRYHSPRRRPRLSFEDAFCAIQDVLRSADFLSPEQSWSPSSSLVKSDVTRFSPSYTR